MSLPADFWETMYAPNDYIYGTDPNRFLAATLPEDTGGLDVFVPGDGEGRNGVWLAEQGHRVTTIDGSPRGLAKARALARRRGVRLTQHQGNLLDDAPPVAAFDVVAAIFLHFPSSIRARMHHGFAAALRPGGRLILEAFTPEQLAYSSGGPPIADMLFTAAMLRADFAALEILSLETAIVTLNEGPRHHGPAAVVRLHARAPID